MNSVHLIIHINITSRFFPPESDFLCEDNSWNLVTEFLSKKIIFHFWNNFTFASLMNPYSSKFIALSKLFVWAIFLINFLIRSYNKKLEVTYWEKYKVYFVKYSHVFLSTWKLVFSAFSNSNVVTWANNFWDVLVWFFLFQKNRSTYKNFLNLILSYFKQLHVIVSEKELE